LDLDPSFLADFVAGVQSARQLPQMLTRVREIDNLRRAWKELFDKIPDSFGPIAHDQLIFRVAPAPLPGFYINLLAKLLR
jgi:hypothetical protein